MTERYPSEEQLLAIETDAATGVEMIPTGASPYYLHFRKLVQRMLLACTRSNDLRVYADGDLTFGVRPGSCVIGNDAVAFDGVTARAADNNVTTSVWLDDGGAIQTATDGFPADRTTHVPLAEIVTEAGAITALTDRRGRAFLFIPDVSTLGLSATVAEIDRALAGVDPTVTAAALGDLTAGSQSSADGLHRHDAMTHDVAGEASFTLANVNADAATNAVLRFSLPSRLPWTPSLAPDLDNGWLRQRRGADSYAMVGVVPVAFTHEGALTGSLTGKLLGVVPVDGVVSDVILSVGANIVSDNAGDGVAAVARVNATALTTAHPAITDAAGAGFRSTAQGHGAAAVVKSAGAERVTRGDVLTVDLARTAAGSISQEAADVVVMVVIRAAAPE